MRYFMEQLEGHGRVRTGCSSRNFLQSGESIVTLSHLFKQHLGTSLSAKLRSLFRDKKRMIFLAEATADFMGFAEFSRYLTSLFEIDALVLNDDRGCEIILVRQKAI